MAGRIVSFRMEGLRELDQALGELPKATAKNVLVRTLLAAGRPMQQQAQALAPARPAGAPQKTYVKSGAVRVRRPGTLKALVQIGTRLTPRQARAARQDGKDFAEVYVGTRDPIARLDEFGTADAPAHPFLRPAFEANKHQALETIRTVLGGEIEKAVQRLARKAVRLAAKG